MNLDVKKFEDIKNEVMDLSKAYVLENEIDEFKNHIDEKLNNFNPTLMIYGVYNAGKSTLINAIFGEEEKAKTSDIPETAKIQAYDYNGYTIFDTPGINAPKEHEEVTHEHLSKCELVLFVIGNIGAFEDRYIYEKIALVLKAKKPVLIVLNNKAKHSKNSQELQAEINRVNEHLSKICDEQGIKEAEKLVEIIFVDARDGLEGKLEQDDELIEESNILVLEKKIDDMLGSYGSKEVTNTLNLYINKFINQAISNIDNKIDDYHLKSIEELITYLEKQKDKILVDVKNMINDTTVQSVKILIEKFLQRDKNSIQKTVNEITEELINKINNLLKQTYEEINQKVKDTQEKFNEMEIKGIEVDDIKKLKQDIKLDSKDTDDYSGVTVALAGVIDVIPPFHPYVAPAKIILKLVLAVYSVFASSDDSKAKAQAELDEKRAYHLSAKNQADDFGYKFKNQIETDTTKNILDLFNNLIFKYSAISNKLNKDNKKILQDKERLLEISNRLDGK